MLATVYTAHALFQNSDSPALRWNKHSIKKGTIYSHQVRIREHTEQTRCAFSAHNLPKSAWGSTA